MNEYFPDFQSWPLQRKGAFFAAPATTYRETRPKANGNGAADDAEPSWPEPEARERAVNINIPTKPEHLIDAVIDAAEEIRDPLDGLVEKTAAFVSWGEFKMTPKGLTCAKKSAKADESDGGEPRTEWISSPFEVLGASRDPYGCSWGKWLRWRDRDKRVHQRHVSDATLQGDSSALCGGLAGEGLSINPNQQRAFRTYLFGCNVKGRVTIVHRTGWHDIGSHRVFVLPDETIGPKGSERVILDASAAGPYEARGTLREWQSCIGAMSSGHALPVLAISAALAGPLLYLAGEEGGGINIFGNYKWLGRRGGGSFGYRASARRIGRCGSARRSVFALWPCQWFG
jgi:putative DNA primase/helicase